MNSVYVLRDVNMAIVGIYQSKESAEARIQQGVTIGDCRVYTNTDGDISYSWTIDWFPVGE